WWRRCGRSSLGFWRSYKREADALPLHRHHQIFILHGHRKGLCHIGAVHQPSAALDVDLETAHLDAARITPGLAGADVIFPRVPRTPDHLALARITIFAGLG